MQQTCEKFWISNFPHSLSRVDEWKILIKTCTQTETWNVKLMIISSQKFRPVVALSNHRRGFFSSWKCVQECKTTTRSGWRNSQSLELGCQNNETFIIIFCFVDFSPRFSAQRFLTFSACDRCVWAREWAATTFRFLSGPTALDEIIFRPQHSNTEDFRMTKREVISSWREWDFFSALFPSHFRTCGRVIVNRMGKIIADLSNLFCLCLIEKYWDQFSIRFFFAMRASEKSTNVQLSWTEFSSENKRFAILEKLRLKLTWNFTRFRNCVANCNRRCFDQIQAKWLALSFSS